MKLTVTNLGRIAHAELELRPLTMFVGKNNTNKSWTAYAAYLGIRAHSYRQHHDGRYKGTDYHLPEGARNAIRGALDHFESSRADFSLLVHRGEVQPTDSSTHLDEPILSRITGAFLRESGAAAAMAYDRADMDAPLFSEVAIQLLLQGDRIRAEASFRGPRGAAEHVADMPMDRLERYLWEQLLTLAFSTHWATIPLPVHRTLRTEVSPPSQPGNGAAHPIAADLEKIMAEARSVAATGRKEGDTQLSGLLGRVSGGRLTVDTDQRIEFRPTEAVRIPLEAAASMVNSLAGLWIYLDGLAAPGDWLVIDEPEMNLHPAAQLALMELFAVMVNRGYRILFTTHSPYLVEHLNTLMEGSRLDPDAKARAAQHFQLQQPDAFLDPEEVAAYEFVEQGEAVVVQDVLDREDATITTWTFAAETQRLGQLMNRVLDAEE